MREEGAILREMLTDSPLRRDIYRVLEFRKDIIPSDYPWTALDHRRVYSASLFEITSEHVSSICLLLLFSRTSSAAALLRSCIESAVRGAWLLLVASDNNVESIVAERGKDKGWPGLEQMIGAIEAHQKAGGLLRRVFTETSALNDLTHGGLMQIGHRMSRHTGQDVEHLAHRMCLRNASNALAFTTSALYLHLNNMPALLTVGIRAEGLFSSFEMAGDVSTSS